MALTGVVFQPHEPYKIADYYRKLGRVVDASVFPSSGAVNPALTVIANALRVGDHLLGRVN